MKRYAASKFLAGLAGASLAIPILRNIQFFAVFSIANHPALTFLLTHNSCQFQAGFQSQKPFISKQNRMNSSWIKCQVLLLLFSKQTVILMFLDPKLKLCLYEKTASFLL